MVWYYDEAESIVLVEALGVMVVCAGVGWVCSGFNMANWQGTRDSISMACNANPNWLIWVWVKELGVNNGGKRVFCAFCFAVLGVMILAWCECDPWCDKLGVFFSLFLDFAPNLFTYCGDVCSTKMKMGKDNLEMQCSFLRRQNWLQDIAILCYWLLDIQISYLCWKIL